MTKEQLTEKLKQLEKRIELLERMAHPQGIMWPTTIPYNTPIEPFDSSRPIC